MSEPGAGENNSQYKCMHATQRYPMHHASPYARATLPRGRIALSPLDGGAGEHTRRIGGQSLMSVQLTGAMGGLQAAQSLQRTYRIHPEVIWKKEGIYALRFSTTAGHSTNGEAGGTRNAARGTPQ